MPNKITLYEQRDFGDVLNASFTFIKQTYKILGKALLQICMPFILLSTIANTLVLDLFYQFLDITLKNSRDFSFKDFPWAKLALLGTVSLLVSYLLYVVLGLVVYRLFQLYQEYENPEDITINDLNTNLYSKATRLFSTHLYTALFIFGGVFLLIIPALYWAFLLAILPAIRYFEEDKSLGKSYSRCIALYSKEGKFQWRSYFQSVGLLLIIILISMSSASVLNSIYQSVGYEPFNPQSMEKGVSMSWGVILITTLFSQLHAAAVGMLTLVVTTLQYFNLVEQADAKSLEADIDAFGQA